MRASDDGAGDEAAGADWADRVVRRSLRTARARSIDRGSALIRAATALLERSGGDDFTVQDVADEAGQSLRTLYQYFESKDDLLLAVFEEAMWTYSRVVRTAIEDLEDPMERLAGAVVAMTRLPTFMTGVAGGLSRLRLKLIKVEPALVGRARAPIADLLQELVDAATAADGIGSAEAESAAYHLLALTTASTTSSALGNDVGIGSPEPQHLAEFCLRGLGADLVDGWYEDLDRRLRYPAKLRPSASPA